MGRLRIVPRASSRRRLGRDQLVDREPLEDEVRLASFVDDTDMTIIDLSEARLAGPKAFLEQPAGDGVRATGSDHPGDGVRATGSGLRFFRPPARGRDPIDPPTARTAFGHLPASPATRRTDESGLARSPVGSHR